MNVISAHGSFKPSLRKSGKNVTPKRFTFSIDPSHSLETMIIAACCGWTNDNITARLFPSTGKGVTQFEAEFAHFDFDAPSKSIVEEDMASGWKQTKLQHLLAFRAAYPKESSKFSVVALGSVVEIANALHVPVLSPNSGQCYLGLRLLYSAWGGKNRSLVVRELPEGL